jgi:AmmeMemoRadiSam system protein A
MEFEFTHEEKQELLAIARQSVAAAAARRPTPTVDLGALPPVLTQIAACFVTLRIDGVLRGCTGSLAAHQPLAVEVIRVAAQTAHSDPRFAPVTPGEVADLNIEISVLTPSRPLAYETVGDLLAKLKPGIDGVTLSRGARRATFLPQVWERIPERERFLSMLSRKMGLRSDAWRAGDMEVEVYQTVSWDEAEMREA